MQLPEAWQRTAFHSETGLVTLRQLSGSPIGNRIGRIIIAGAITQFALPSVYSFPVNIAVGPDGNLYFTEEELTLGDTGAKIGRVVLTLTGTPSQRFVSQVYMDLLARLPDAAGCRIEARGISGDAGTGMRARFSQAL